MAAVRTGKPFEFGPDGSLLGSITEPAQAHSGIGVILFGMGVAEVQAARRFAKLGFVAMQIRLVKDLDHFNDMDRRNETYDATGVAGCRHAIDYLVAERQIEKVVLMGNCAGANISFNTALADPRAIGVIMTNPHVSELLTARVSYKRNLFSMRSWRRLFTGKTRLRGLRGLLMGSVKGADEKTLLTKYPYKKDLVLPLDFGRKLEGLAAERGVRALIVFAQTEASLGYFRQSYAASIDRLVASGNLRFEVLSTDTHVFSTDDHWARVLNEIIEDWAGTLPTARRSQAA